jgi:AsmA protein
MPDSDGAEPEIPRIDLFARRDTPPALPPVRPRRRGNWGLRLALLGGVALVVVAGGYLVVGSVAGPDKLKADIEASIGRATGRRFTISGPLHVSLSLSPSITAEDISLANVPDGSRPDMLTAKSLTAQVALLPLLAGDVVVEDVTLAGADVLLEQDTDGQPNWQFRAQRRSLYEAPAAPKPEGPRGGGSVEIHHVHLEGGHIAWKPGAGTMLVPPLSADFTSADLGAPNDDSPMHGVMTGQAGGNDFTATLDTGAFGRLEGEPVGVLAGAWPLTLKIQAGDAALSMVGGINHPDEMRGYEFQITGNAPSLAPFAPLLPGPLKLPLRDVNVTLRISDGANGQVRTSGLSLHAGPADLTSAIPGLILKEAVLSAPGPGQQAQLNVDGTFQGAPLRVVGTATQPDVLEANVPVPLAISAQAASATVSARGTVPPNIGSTGQGGIGLDMLVSVRAPTLADLSPLAGRPLPDVRDVVFDAHVGDAGFRLRGLSMRDLTFTSSLGDLSGNVTLAWSPVPTLSGSVSAKTFDLDAAAAAWNQFNAAAPGAVQAAPPAPPPPAVAPDGTPAVPGAATPDQPAPRFFSDTPLPFGQLKSANADLTLTAGTLVAGQQKYRDLNAKLLANDGKIILNPLRVSAPEGMLIGGLTLDAADDPPPVSVSLRSPSMSAAGLASLLGYAGGATGTVQVDANLNGTGNTPHELAASLSGHLGLTMVNGSLTDTLLESVFSGALSAAGIPSFGGSQDVHCLALLADFSHGQGSVQALSLDTSKMSLDGDGSVDLGDETVALHLRPTVSLGGTGVAAPVSLRGSFGNLKASLDPAMGGGRYGLTIGGPAPNDDACISKLSEARGGMPGPLPSVAVAPQADGGKRKKPIDLLRGLFH